MLQIIIVWLTFLYGNNSGRALLEIIVLEVMEATLKNGSCWDGSGDGGEDGDGCGDSSGEGGSGADGGNNGRGNVGGDSR